MWITLHYNADTNVLDWVQYPEDTAETRTEYSYDALYRLATAETMVDSGYSLDVEYGYTDDLLTSIMTNSTTYNFTYGLFAQSAAIKVGSRILASYEYTDNQNRYLQKMTYHNGVADDTVDENDFIQYNYDTQGRLILETYEDGDTVAYTYDNNGALATVTDSATGRKTTYYYDFTDRLMKYTESGTNFYHSVGYEYDSLNNLTSLVEIINGVEHSTTYTYDDDNRVSGATTGNIISSYAYDDYGRLEYSDTWVDGYDGICKEYYYTNPASGTTSSQIKNYQADTPEFIVNYDMTYDDNGNLTSIETGSMYFTYVYDSANQLIRENNSEAEKTWVWNYDNAGNILSRTEYAYTTGELGEIVDTVVYSYTDPEWGDLLTAYDGVLLSYDGIGNLTNDGTWTYTWEHGRELSSMTDGTTTWNYTYDANGMRTSRTNGTTSYNYIYNGSQLVQMTVGNNTLHFTYDASGAPVVVDWNGTLYYYVTSFQGDVQVIMNLAGEVVVQYVYDAWGNIVATDGELATTLGELNPLRYRSYVYDSETGLYYLQSRYYNPEWGRFVNADGYTSTGQGTLGNNMFAYCGNNPVIREDDGGEFWNIVIGAAVGGVVSGLISIATQVIENQGLDNINWASVAVSTVAGAVSGALAATGIPVGGQVIANGIIGAVSSGIDTYVEKGEDATMCDYVISMGTGAIVGGLGGFIGGDGTGTKHLSRSAGRLLKKVGNACGDMLDDGLRATGKIVSNAWKYYYSQVAKQSIQCGKKAILPIVISNIPNALHSTLEATS